MRPRRMRILVIGAAGMLGGKLVERLARDGRLGFERISQLTLVDPVVAEPPGDPGFAVQSTVADLAKPGWPARSWRAAPTSSFTWRRWSPARRRTISRRATA